MYGGADGDFVSPLAGKRLRTSQKKQFGVGVFLHTALGVSHGTTTARRVCVWFVG